MSPLDANRIRAALDADALGWLASLEVFDSIDSTNSHLMRKASSASIDGCVSLAEHQSSGRGRRGRSWTTARGRNVALSIGHRIDVPAPQLGALSLVVGVACAAALARAGLPGVRLKWPNDLLLDEKKLGGVLIEVVPQKQPLETIIGIGINVARSSELESVGVPVASIDDVHRDIERNALVAALIGAVHRAASEFVTRGFAAFRTAWNGLNAHAGRTVRVTTPTTVVEGTVLGVAEQGELMLQTGDEVRLVNAGEVTLRGAD